MPVPPTVTIDPELITIVEEGIETTRVSGGPGVFDPPNQRVRVSNADPPVDSIPPPVEFTEVTTGADGSFSATLLGTLENVFFIEVILEEEDLFMVAVQGGMDGPVQTVTPLDSDGDGSPDAIDCAPDDRAFGGQRCP
jgi:hypothetical protein